MNKPDKFTATEKLQHTLEIRLVIFTLKDNQLGVFLSPSTGPHPSDVWEIPGVPSNIEKSLEETATQYLTRTMGMEEAYLEQLYTYGDSDRHPDYPLVSVVYFALIPADASQQELRKRASLRCFPVNAVPGMVMDHKLILDYALRRLRYKLEYSAVGFELLPETFTLSELQNTYEIILGVNLDKRNFRRRILEAGIIESTPHRRSGEGRPAQLYRYRPDAIAEVKARRLFP
jgi:8-oxo-dGTP diphosphatase